jgi:long-chain acyl-CoA synthetase
MDGAENLATLARRCMDGPERPVLAERAGGTFVPMTNRQLLARVDALAHALWDRGICPGDRVALMSPNRIDWIVANLAILSVGAVTVPLYPTQAVDHAQIILNDSAARLLFIDSQAAKQRLAGSGVNLPDTVVFDDPGESGLAALERKGAALRDAAPERLAAFVPGIDPGALAILIYTSGTTGVPKGVMLTHGNIASNATSAFANITDVLPGGDPVVSVLPWAHIYEHTDLFGLFLRHAVIHVVHSPDELLADLLAVRPVAFFAVPRIFERVLAGVIAKSRADGGLRARLVPWALAVGRAHQRAVTKHGRASLWVNVQYLLAKLLVLRRLKPALGLDRIRFIVSGSAPLHVDIALTLAGAGIVILEGYGLTECSPIVCVNTPQHHKFGTVGRPIDGVEVRIDDDGELLVRGPNVMQGYYHDPAATAATMRDGWLATGDMASIDAEGYISITDRKKEVFKTSGGKFVAPTRVESAMLRSPFLGQVMVVGSGRPHPVALVSPNWPVVRRELGIAPEVSTAEASRLPDVKDFLTAEAVTNTRDLATFEQIRRVGVLPRDLTIDEGELSPTLKVRRRVVEQRYADLIEAIYGAPAAI